MAFTHLHVHTEYSLLDGAAKIGRLVDKAAALGMKSLAITDHGVMYGAVEFYRACKEAGIRPIIGCEVYVAPRTRFDKDAAHDRELGHLILLAKDAYGRPFLGILLHSADRNIVYDDMNELLSLIEMQT